MFICGDIMSVFQFKLYWLSKVEIHTGGATIPTSPEISELHTKIASVAKMPAQQETCRVFRSCQVTMKVYDL